MRGKFLFGLNESFSRFRKDVFYRDGQRKPEDPPFTPAFVVSQVILRRHNIQTSFWLIPPQKNKFTLPLPRQRTNWSKNLRADQDLERSLTDIAFSVVACSNTTVTYAQLQARLADVVTKLITLQASVNRLPKRTEPLDLPPIHLPHRVPDGNTWDWWNKKSTPTPFPWKAYSIRTASPS